MMRERNKDQESKEHETSFAEKIPSKERCDPLSLLPFLSSSLFLVSLFSSCSLLNPFCSFSSPTALYCITRLYHVLWGERGDLFYFSFDSRQREKTRLPLISVSLFYLSLLLSMESSLSLHFLPPSSSLKSGLLFLCFADSVHHLRRISFFGSNTRFFCSFFRFTSNLVLFFSPIISCLMSSPILTLYFLSNKSIGQKWYCKFGDDHNVAEDDDLHDGNLGPFIVFHVFFHSFLETTLMLFLCCCSHFICLSCFSVSCVFIFISSNVDIFAFVPLTLMTSLSLTGNDNWVDWRRWGSSLKVSLESRVIIEGASIENTRETFLLSEETTYFKGNGFERIWNKRSRHSSLDSQFNQPIDRPSG